VYIILSEHNKLSSITFDKICGHLLFWLDAHIYNLWEHILVKKNWFCKLFVGVCIELVELQLCKVVYWTNAMNNTISWAYERECEHVNMNRWVGWNLCENLLMKWTKYAQNILCHGGKNFFLCGIFKN